jgi:hypothetical protein
MGLFFETRKLKHLLPSQFLAKKYYPLFGLADFLGFFYCMYRNITHYGAVCGGAEPQNRGAGFDFRCSAWKCSRDLILPSAFSRREVHSASNRNEYQGIL